MSPPNVIRANVRGPFLTRILPTGFITLTKANGVWTIGFDVSSITELPVAMISDRTAVEAMLYTPATKAFNVVTLSDLHGVLAAQVSKYVTATADVTIADGETSDTIEIDNTSGAAISVYLPTATVRKAPLTIVDVGGNAGTNAITVKPKSGTSETIMTGSQYVIDTNGGRITLTPNSNKTGYR